MDIKAADAIITVKVHNLTSDDIDPFDETTSEFNYERDSYSTVTRTVQPTSVWITYKRRRHDGHIGASVSARGRVVEADGELGKKIVVRINNKERPDGVHALVEKFRPNAIGANDQLAVDLDVVADPTPRSIEEVIESDDQGLLDADEQN